MQDEKNLDSENLQDSQSCASDSENADSENCGCKDEQQNTQQEAQNSESNGSNELDYRLKFEELKDEYLRYRADFENVKKRLEREKFQSLEYANEQFGKDLLPVLDALDKALESAKTAADEGIIKGLELTMESFFKTLNKHGIERIRADGEFDPNLHECLMQVPDDSKQDGQIGQVLQAGYKYKERTLRPAMVSIVKNS